MDINISITFPALDRLVDLLSAKQQKQLDDLAEKLKTSGAVVQDALDDASHSG